MEITSGSTKALAQKCDCLVLPVNGKNPLQDTDLAAIDTANDGLLQRLIGGGEISGKVGDTLSLHGLKGLAAKRLLLVGIGVEIISARAYLKIAGAAAKALDKGAITSAATPLCELTVDGRDTFWQAQQLARLLGSAAYRYGENISKPKPASKLKKITLLCGKRKNLSAAKGGATYGQAVASGVNRARWLGDLPANICTPSYLARQARALARKHRTVSCEVLNEKRMAELGMGALLSVTAGTKQPAQLIALRYQGAAKNAKPVVLVGKGVTFDSGGISLKPGAKMDEMKYDMCGAASVFGVFESLAANPLPINVIGLVPAVENLPSGTATKPGDVVKSMSGQTIEILNTDAEGRLILCDALSYAARYKPEVVIDIATLTGACVVALGSHATGLCSNDDDLAQALLDAGEIAGDRAWQLPLWEEYDQQLKTGFADMANIGGPGAGTITAACFLARFTRNYRWAHLDIAGTAWQSAGPKGATGRPVPLLMDYLQQRCQ